jgi:hypothetical protein
MRTQFTPGPWYAVQYANQWAIQSIPGYEGSTFDVLDEENDDNHEANARLAASAISLFSTIETVLNKCLAAEGESMHDAFELLDWLKDVGNNLMRDSIAKATGEKEQSR